MGHPAAPRAAWLGGRLQPSTTDRQFPSRSASLAGKGRGITTADMREFRWVWPEPVVQVRFSEWTPDGRLRQAAYQGQWPAKITAEVLRE